MSADIRCNPRQPQMQFKAPTLEIGAQIIGGQLHRDTRKRG
jgi:hypothetical protein